MAALSDQELQQPLANAATDRMQAMLVSEAQRGDEAATMTLVVQFGPALRAMARRRGGHQATSRSEATSDVVSAFTESVLTHNLVRRPSRIAANLVWDTRQRLARADHRQRWALGAGNDRVAEGLADTDGPTDGVVAASIVATDVRAQPDQHADALDLQLAVADALDALPGSASSNRLTRELAYRAWFLDQTAADIATEMGLGATTVRTRLCRLRSAVRAAESAAA